VTDPWPTPEQRVLLQAALLPGPPALAAWEKWRSAIDIDRLDSDSYWALPQLYANLKAHGVSDELIGRLKGVYRLTWYQNQVRVRAMSRPLRALHESGTPTMLLKGAALAAHHYADYGLRPMSDFDICTTADSAPAAVRLLLDAGLVPLPSDEGEPEQHFEDAQGRILDLHWRVFPESLSDDSDAEYWNASVPIALNGTPVRILNPADQLLHICIHGTVHGPIWGEVSKVRWVMDACAILRASAAPVDWDRVVAMAARSRFTLPLHEALTYLRRAVGAPVPEAVLERLRVAPVSRADRITHRVRRLRADQCWPWIRLCAHYVEHASTQPPGTGPVRTLATFPAYYRRVYGTERWWRMALIAVFRGTRLICRTLRWHARDWLSRHGASRPAAGPTVRAGH
jgi:hypothetical protein